MRRRSGPRRIFRFPLRGQVEQDVDAELRFHLEMRTEDLVEEKGMTSAAAREEALRRFGDLNRITDTCHEIGKRREKAMWWSELLAELRQDLGYALRQIGKAPLFTLIAVLTLALGIGATTAIFSIVDAVVLRPLPFSEPDRLVNLWETNPQTDSFSISEPNYLDWREANRSFTDMAAISYDSLGLIGQGEPVKLHGAAVTASFFPLLDARPLLGRTFLSEEDRPGDAPVVVLSHRLWQSRFGADPGIVGRSLRLEGRSFTVLGVMPAGFVFPDWADLWIPLAPGTNPDRGDRWLDVVARLKPGVSLEQARSDLDGVAARLAEQYPESNRDWGVRLAPLRDAILGPQVTRALLALFAAVGLLLLMACVNVSNLLLARATVRGREMGLRSALGAGRARLIRQLLTESMLLAGLGAFAGLGVAYGAVELVRAFGPDSVPRLDQVSLDGRVLAFTVAVALVTGLLFGLAPALQASRADLYALLQQGGRAAIASGRRLRDGLVVGELALAMVLLICAGLMIGSFLRLQSVDTGFEPEDVLTVRLDLPPEEYPAARRQIFLPEVLRRISGLPGVRAAGATNAAPFSAFRPNNTFAVEGRESRGEGDFLSADWRSVTPGFHRALGIPLRRGRLFTEADREGALDVIVISETMAERIWPGEDPIGRRIFWGGAGGTAITVVGVVGDVRDMEIQEAPHSIIFLPYQQIPWAQMTLVIQAAGDVPGLAAAIRREIRALDGNLPIPEVRPLRQSVASAVAEPRFRMFLFVLFAAAALALAVTGVYGVMAFAVAQRTREIGVRLALGARPWSVVGLVLRRGLLLTLLGIGLGWAGAFALTRFLASLLYGTEPTDAVIYAAVALLLAAVATVAGYAPARRAAAIDPRLAFGAE